MRTSRRVLFATMCGATMLMNAPAAGAQDADVCAIYGATLSRLMPDSVVKLIVVYDSVSLATPSFAFHAWTGRGLPKADSRVPLTDSLWQRMRLAHRDRDALPSCFGQGRAVRRVWYDSLRAPFKNRESGWDDFRTAFPGAGGFHVLGSPLFLNAERSEAFLYVAQASHWLSGAGRVVFLRKTEGVWQVVDSHALWLS